MKTEIQIGPHQLLSEQETLQASYKKRYSMNVVGKDGATTTVAIPPEVVGRKAEEAGLSTEEFVRSYRVVAHYDNFDGVLYRFEEIPK